MEHSRWSALLNQLKITDTENTFNKLLSAYSETHRHYHNKEHISAMLRHFDKVVDQAAHPEELEIAIWFHDAIYNPHSNSNELDSANWAKQFLLSSALDAVKVNRIYQLIMATMHQAKTLSNDENLIVDIDLTILGSPRTIYDKYESNIRKEYDWVSLKTYKRKRKEILKQFLDSERIYYCQDFYSRLELQAKKNLAYAIKKL